MRITCIAAVARNGVIGREGRLPWRLPLDLQHFRRLTLGKPLLMGRVTYASIGVPLPGRTMIVVTRDARFEAPGCTVVGSPQAGLEAARALGSDEVMVAGGASIYATLLPLAERLELTRVEAEIPGDAYFPALQPGTWRELWSEPHEVDARHAYPFTFVRLERVSSGALATGA